MTDNRLLLIATIIASLGALTGVPGTTWATEITRGPYVQNVSADAITIVWDQDTPSRKACDSPSTPAI